MRPIRERLREGEYDREPVAVIGGGPSLKGFDIETVRCRRICVNMAAELGGFLSYSSDENCVRILEDLGWKDWDTIRVLWAGLKTMQLSEKSGEYFFVDVNGKEMWSTRISALPQAGNSGIAAYNLADALGFSPIFLFGFDLTGKDGRTANWHDYYMHHGDASCYDRMLEQFSTRVPDGVREKTVVVGPSRLTELGFKNITHDEWEDYTCHAYG